MDINSFLDRYTISVPESGCALWLNYASRFGYGVLGDPSKRGTVQAHRLSYRLAYGEIPDGAHVCHKCDVRLCVRPDHLFLGSAKTNRLDCARKGRHKWPAFGGEHHPMARLTSEQIAAIRADSRTQRQIAADYGISFQHVSDIIRGKRWRAVQ